MRILLILLSVVPFFSGPVSADLRSVAACQAESPSTELLSISDLMKMSEGGAALTPEQVKSAPCRGEPQSRAQIEAWIKNSVRPGERKVSRNVHGIQIDNEDESLVNALDELLTVKGKGGRIDEEKNALQKTFKSECHTVLCAVSDQALFEKDVGPKILYLSMRYRLNASHHIYTPASPMSAAEISDVIQSVSDLPETLLPLPSSTPLVRYERGKLPTRDKFAVDTIGDHQIRLFDKWEELKPELRQSSLLHELLGHKIPETYEMDEDSKWLALSQWTVTSDDEWASSDQGKFINGYASVNPYEDMAESVEVYRYNPSLLQKKDPNKYAFIRDTLFDGVEYASQVACEKVPVSLAHAREVQVKIASLLTDAKKQQAMTDAVFASCGNRVIYEKIKGRESTVSRKTCVQGAMVEKLLPNASQLVKDRVAAAIVVPESDQKKVDQLVTERFRTGMQKWLMALDQFGAQMGGDCEMYSKFAYRHLKTKSVGVVFTSTETFAFNNQAPLNAIAKEYCEYGRKNAGVDSALRATRFLAERY